jgi:hypothetical protein
MRITLHLVATLVLFGATTTRAQITSPDTLIAPPPRNPALPSPKSTDNAQWLWQFTRPAPSGDQPALLKDPRFTALLSDHFKAPQAMWGVPGSSLVDAVHAFLAGAGTVSSADNRHLIISGHTLVHAEQAGMLWVDLGETSPLIVFAALRWNEQSLTPGQPGAPFTLWLFPSRELDAHHLPGALKSSVARFATADSCHPTNLTSAIVVEPSGMPFVIGPVEAGAIPGLCPSTSTGTHA